MEEPHSPPAVLPPTRCSYAQAAAASSTPQYSTETGVCGEKRCSQADGGHLHRVAPSGCWSAATRPGPGGRESGDPRFQGARSLELRFNSTG